MNCVIRLSKDEWGRYGILCAVVAEEGNWLLAGSRVEQQYLLKN